MSTSRPERESPRAVAAFEDYWNMGEARSLPGLAKRYQAQGSKAPTRQLTTLKIWSATFAWQDRLAIRAREQARAQARDRLMVETAIAEDRKARIREFEQDLVGNGKRLAAAAMAQIAEAVAPRTPEGAPRRTKPIPSAAVSLLALAVKMQARGLGVSFDRYEMTGPDGKPLQVQIEAAIGLFPEGLRRAAFELAARKLESSGGPAALPSPEG